MPEPTALGTLRAALAADSYEHREPTVVHRWYTGYETGHRNLDNQGELITDDFTIAGPSMDDLVQELTLQMAAAALQPPPGASAA